MLDTDRIRSGDRRDFHDSRKSLLEPLPGAGFCFAFFHSPGRQFPQSAEKSLGLPLLKKKSAAMDQRGHHSAADRQRGPGLAYRIQRYPTRLIRPAIVGYRTAAAFRRARQAKNGAEVHQGLIEKGCFSFGEKPVCERLEPVAARREVGIRGKAEQTAKDPGHVSVQDSHILVEGDTGDSPGRVRADAGQALEDLDIVRNLSTQFVYDLSGSSVEIPRPAVIAESLPRGKNLVQGGLGQRVQSGKSVQKSLVSGSYSFHPCLLEKNLGNPDPVGVPGPPPGKVPAAPVVPKEEIRLDGRPGTKGHGDPNSLQEVAQSRRRQSIGAASGVDQERGSRHFTFSKKVRCRGPLAAITPVDPSPRGPPCRSVHTPPASCTMSMPAA